MAAPKSQTEFDPSRTPFTSPAPRFTYMEHPEAGLLMINSDSKRIVPIPDQPYPGTPIRIPKELMDVPQPFVHTCGVPGNGNRGCIAAVNGGCPIIQQFGRSGPHNLIIEKHGNVNSARCYHVYCGIADSGRPTSQVHYLLDGWNILTDRTTIPENVRVTPGSKRETVRQTEVPELAPFYDHLKTNGNAPAKKKIGRPRKVPVGAD